MSLCDGRAVCKLCVQVRRRGSCEANAAAHGKGPVGACGLDGFGHGTESLGSREVRSPAGGRRAVPIAIRTEVGCAPAQVTASRRRHMGSMV